MKYKLTKYRLKRSAFQPSDGYMYHAFVSYSSTDEEWVATELVKKLEQGSSIQLFFFAETGQARMHQCDVILHGLLRDAFWSEGEGFVCRNKGGGEIRNCCNKRETESGRHVLVKGLVCNPPGSLLL